MDGFFGYNQIEILPTDQHKMTLIFPWGTFAYKKLPFCLKNAGATFQHAMSYAFHDIFGWTYEEIPGIDLSIVVHDIITYPMTKPI